MKGDGGGRKRKRGEEQEDGTATPTPVRRYVRRNGLKREGEEMELRQAGRKRQAVEVTSSTSMSNVEYPLRTSYSTTPKSFSVSSDERFTAFLAPRTTMAKSQSFKVHKPYSLIPKTHFSTPGQSFINIILSTCRPYHQPTQTILHEEIKVEDEPLGGLDALSRAVELATTAPLSILPEPLPHQLDAHLQFQHSELETYYPPSSSGSTLTVYSMSPESHPLRLPTPPSQSPPPSFEDTSPTMKKRKTGPARATADEAEARRLQGLMTEEELDDFRKKRRRGNTYVFGVASLKKELNRLGRTY
jgi:hypothetical protein